MPSLLKQFSLDEAPKNPEPSKEPQKKVAQDVLQQKYVIGKSAAPEPTPHKSKKKTAHRNASADPSQSQISFVTLLTSPHFSSRNYLLQLPTLFLAGMSYWGTYLILKNVQPAAIQNTFLPNFYLPLLIITGLGHFFMSWYILQNARRSFFIALFLTTVLFLRIHQLFGAGWILASFLPLLLIELLLTFKSFRR